MRDSFPVRIRPPRRILLAILTAGAALLAGCTTGAIGANTPTTPTPTQAAPSTSTVTTAAPAASTSSGGATQAAGNCSPDGTSLQISAHNVKFDKSCLAAPAGTAFTITFANKDSGVPHNVDIFTNKSATKSLFKGSVVTGPKTVTYKVPALKAGTYYFRCDIHPTQMFGTFVVG